MKTLLNLFLFGLLLPCIALCGCSRSDSTIGIADDDPEMIAAINKARGALPLFWSKFEHPGPGETNFCLKVMIHDSGHTEHFWVNTLDKKDGKLSGNISNEPEFVHNVKLGQRIDIPDADISDWFYMRDGKMVGNYTLRVLFDHMPPDEVAKYRALLADP